MKQKKEKCDFVILGSGIGGLCSAALLANKGYKTIVVEKLPIVGGRCATLKYKGYKIPTGLLGVPMVGSFKSIFDEVGAEFEVTPMTTPPKYLVGNKIIDTPKSNQPYAVLSELCSDEKEIEILKHGITKAQTWNPPSNEMSLQDFVCQYTENENLVEYFSNMSDRILSTRADQVSAKEYFQSFSGSLKDFQSVGFAPEGSMALMKSLKKSIEANGGKVTTQCRANKILVKNGGAEGVVVEDKKGETIISAKAVISNTGPKKTVALAGRENFDKGYLRELKNMVPSLQIWVTSISDRPLFDVPILYTFKTRRLVSLVSASLVCPELAPKGKYVHYSISSPVSQIAPWNLKNEVNMHIQDLKDQLPGYNKYGEVLHVGCYWGEWPTLANAPIVGYNDISQKTPIENLYNVGDGVAKKGGWAGGSPACALTAKIVVKDIENRFNP
ncbi:MAG: FAD-dependent oxidoreductase [Proteobacteria bacterium]|nr:FAD-dependent oxidoreductase [Pseudomonadota bacterium]